MKKNKSQKQNHIIVPVVFLLLLAGGGLWQLFSPDRSYSPAERRLLAQRPEIRVENILDASFMPEYEAYLTDQFPMRDQWITVKTYCGLMLGQRETGGVYIAEDHSLIELHRETEVDADRCALNTDTLTAFAADMAEIYGKEHIRIMLVPTAESIWSGKLPKNLELFDQSLYLEQLTQALTDIDPDYSELVVDTQTLLRAHAQEEIYYKTDHHWTVLGAYYGYLAYIESLSDENGPQTVPRPLSAYEFLTVTETFTGTTAAKCGMYREKDRIMLVYPMNGESYRVDHNAGMSVTDTLYDLEKVTGEDPYAVYLGGNDAIVTIRTTQQMNGSDQEANPDWEANSDVPEAETYTRRLLIIRDSYASCMAAYLTGDYEEITLVDLRYYNASVRKLMKEGNYTDLLVLYNIPNFVAERTVYKLVKTE